MTPIFFRPGDTFRGKFIEGALCTVISIDVDKNHVEIEIDPQKENRQSWVETEWNLQHTYWGFGKEQDFAYYDYKPTVNSPATHVLKTWPKEYKDISDGYKRFDVRKNDRDFRVNDAVTFKEYDPNKKEYTGRHGASRIVYFQEGGQWGIMTGYCVIGIA